MNYFFIPGRLKELSIFELNCFLNSNLKEKYTLTDKGEYFLLETSATESILRDIFFKLGGFLKYGIILDSEFVLNDLTDSEKVVFGMSSYSKKYDYDGLKKLAHKFKQEFESLGKKVRFVTPKEGNALSTAQVLKNKCLELVLLDDGFGKTLGVQDIEKFAKLDYDKPFVDAEMGVLPVKLARMMVNFAQAKEGSAIWDPFCGSGNILLQALDLNFDVVGSDIDERSLDGSKENINWSKKVFDYKNASNVFYLDVLNPTKSKVNILQGLDIGAIVCEPYMGKPQRRSLNIHQANVLVKQHYELVENLFFLLSNLRLKKSINIVVIFPEYKTYKGWVSVEKNLLNFKNTKLIQKDLHWSRENSIIKRLIFVFEYNVK